MIDRAVLKPTQAERELASACTLALRKLIASVCVQPFYVSVTARLTKDSGVLAATDDALAMIGAGATRLGTSSTAEIHAELRRRRGEV